MVTQELISHIEKARSSGQSDAQIKSALLNVGWSEADIDQAMGGVSSEPAYPQSKFPSNPPFIKKALFFIGILVLQIIFIIFITLLAFMGAFLFSLLAIKSPIYFIIGIVLYFLLIVAVPILSAIWVYRDSKRFLQQGVEVWIPGGWAFVVLFFWLPAFSIYLTLRKFNYKKVEKIY